MNIGEVIRAERARMSLTQAQLAERIGVSAQAVSKWETGAGMPDIMQIAVLARELHVSADRLLGTSDRYKELNTEWLHACFAYEGGRGDVQTLIGIDERALCEYPDDLTFMYRRSVDKYRAALDCTDERRRADILTDAMGNTMWAMTKHPDDDSLISILVKILVARGERDRALEYAYKSKNKDALLKLVLVGGELRRHRQRLIEKKLRTLLHELDCGDLDLLGVKEDIIRAVIPDGNYVWLYDDLAMTEVRRAEVYASEGKWELAKAAAQSAFSIAAERDTRRERRFTAPIFDMLDPEREDTPALSEQILWVCEHSGPLAALRSTPEYEAMAAEARKLSGEN